MHFFHLAVLNALHMVRHSKSTRRIPYVYQFLFLHLWQCLPQLGWRDSEIVVKSTLTKASFSSKSSKNLRSWRQEFKAYRRISGYTAITSLRISFGTPSIPGAVLALSFPLDLFNSTRVNSFSHRTTQELRSCLWNDTTCGNKLHTMYSTRAVLPFF